MRTIYLTLLLLLPTSLADVNCRTACQECYRDDGTIELLDIYCSMCNECNQRKKDRLRMALLRQQNTELFKKEPEEMPDSYLEYSDNDAQQLREAEFSSESGIFGHRRTRSVRLHEDVYEDATTLSNNATPSHGGGSGGSKSAPSSSCANFLCPMFHPGPPPPPPPVPMLCMPPQPCAFPAAFPAYPPFPPPRPYPYPPPPYHPPSPSYPPPPPPSSETPTSQSTSKHQQSSTDTTTTQSNDGDKAKKQEFLLMYLGVPKDKPRRTLYK